MKTIVKIRAAKNHDAKKIYGFLCEQEEHLFDFKEFERIYRDCIADNNNVYLVSVDAANMATGFISCHGRIVMRYGGMIYEIQELFIEKKHRNSGVARMLVKELERNLMKEDYRLLGVAVDPQKPENGLFFKGCGFRDYELKMVKSKD